MMIRRQRLFLVLVLVAAVFVTVVCLICTSVGAIKTPYIAQSGSEYQSSRNRVRRIPERLDVQTPLLITRPWVFDELMVLYHHVQEVFNERNITFWATSGTMLGAIRHGGFMPWDDDMDLALPMSEMQKLQEALPALSARGVSLMQVDPQNIDTPLKFVRTGTTFPFVDLFLVAHTEHNNVTGYFYCTPLDDLGRCTFWNAGRWPRDYIGGDDLLPLQLVVFEDSVVPVPNRVVNVAKQMFGEDVLTSARGEFLGGHARGYIFEKLATAQIDKAVAQTELMTFT